jgi:TorA maturation chaperone TorD
MKSRDANAKKLWDQRFMAIRSWSVSYLEKVLDNNQKEHNRVLVDLTKDIVCSLCRSEGINSDQTHDANIKE